MLEGGGQGQGHRAVAPQHTAEDQVVAVRTSSPCCASHSCALGRVLTECPDAAHTCCAGARRPRCACVPHTPSGLGSPQVKKRKPCAHARVQTPQRAAERARVRALRLPPGALTSPYLGLHGTKYMPRPTALIISGFRVLVVVSAAYLHRGSQHRA